MDDKGLSIWLVYTLKRYKLYRKWMNWRGMNFSLHSPACLMGYYNSFSHDFIIVFSQVASSLNSIQNMGDDMKSDLDLLDIVTAGLSNLFFHDLDSINLFWFNFFFCFNSILIFMTKFRKISARDTCFYKILCCQLDAGYSRWSHRFPHIKAAVGRLS